MPAIHLFSRRTILGGDDLQLPALITMLLRIFQLTLLLLPMSLCMSRDVHDWTGGSLSKYLWYDPPYNNGNNGSGTTLVVDSCRHSHIFPLLLFLYILSSGLLCLVTLLLEGRLYHWSSQGPPTETQPRSKHVEALMELKLVPIGIAKGIVWFVGFSAIFFAQRYHQCRAMSSNHSNGDSNGGGGDNGDDASHINPTIWNSTYLWFWVAYGLLLFLQMMESFLSMAFVVGIFASRSAAAGHPSIDADHDTSIPHGLQSPSTTVVVAAQSPHDHHLVETMWQERCDTFCQGLSASTCFLFGGKELVSVGGHYYEGVAKALADYFETRGVLDVVPSDIVTGLLVLQRVQRQRILDARQVVKTESQRTLTTLSSKNMNSSSSSSNNNSSSRLFSTSVSKLNSRKGTTSNSSDLMLTLSKSSDGLPEEDCGPWADLLSPIIKHRNNLNHNSSNFNSSGNIDFMMDSTGSLPLDALQPHHGDHSLRSTKSVYRRHAPASSEASPYYVWESRKILSRNKPLDLRILQEGARFSRYALAIYSWVLYLYIHPITGIPILLCRGKGKSSSSSNKSCCCKCCRSKQSASQQQQQQQQQPQHRRQSSSPSSSYHDEEQGRGATTDTAAAASAASAPRTTDTSGMPSPPPSPSLPGWMGGRIEGDNFCETHKAALLLQSGLDDSDLIYAQLKSSFSANPYCIMVDHKWRSVVVAIRGTFSLEDCVTDVTITPESMESLGRDFGFDGTNQYCHGGVLQSVRNIYRDLQRHQYLDQLMLGENARYRGYTLRLVGHSLGGAIATILSYKLRQRFPRLQCINYSPPGCSISWELAIGCREWCTTFVLDCDLVPRLTLDTMDQLRNDVLELIGRIKIPKIAVARKFVRGTGLLSCRGCLDEDQDKDRDYLLRSIQDMLYDRNEVPDSEYQRQLAQFNLIQEERRSSRTFRSIKLFPPGRIVHLMKTGERRSCSHSVRKCLTCCMSNAGFEYTAVWLKNDDLNEIVVSPTMGTDHFPDRICFELEHLAQEYGLDINVMERTTSFATLPIVVEIDPR